MEVTRRWVLRCLALLATLSSHPWAAWGTTPVQASSPFRYLTPAEGQVLEAVTALLIPTDEDPGAKELHLAVGIDVNFLKYPDRLALYREGLRWLDETSQEIYAKEFLVLPVVQQEEILRIADRITERPDRGEALDPTGVGRRFFQRVRLDTFALFYNHPSGWKMVGFSGPPQPRGHLDYADPPR
ncbi:MAG: gluconate 2-dehydrogenase subunit 3 family protein [Nitrospirae bacterium]|nr:gluconate 2-dehydrogenase subunit 3 family protein [Nitrospirota bacterium]